jgi:predicted XRE-type DNA-binding protein
MHGEQIEEIEVYPSSGNVFADLGLPDAEELMLKAELAHQISELITARRLSQVQAAEILGVDQPKVSALVRGKLSGFSIERLFKFLNALGAPVEIRVMRSGGADAQASTRVVTA